MLGKRIKKFIDGRGIKQTFLAAKIGVSDGAMSAICAGDRSIDAVEYYLICKALNVPLEYFFSDDESN